MTQSRQLGATWALIWSNPVSGRARTRGDKGRDFAMKNFRARPAGFQSAEIYSAPAAGFVNHDALSWLQLTQPFLESLIAGLRARVSGSVSIASWARPAYVHARPPAQRSGHRPKRKPVQLTAVR